MNTLDPIDALSQFTARFARDPVPAASLDVMGLCLLDWAVCGLGAVDDPIAAAMLTHAATAGPGTVAVFFSTRTVPPRMAALVNGTMSHALDFDDTHFGHIGHVSTVVIPAALAVAQAERRDFDRFLTAARVGAETAVRVGLWLGRAHYQAGWHQTATAGAYGAAVASAMLMDAPVAPTLRIVAGMATGQKSQFGSAMKPMNAGLAAAHGVEAAQLARAGLDGSQEVLAGVLEPQAGEGNLAAFDRLGEDWLFDTVSYKYHACCHGTHAMIEAILSLEPLDVDQIDRITVITHPRWMRVCNKPDPATWLEGKFSYRFLAALILRGGRTIGAAPEGYFPLDTTSRNLIGRMDVVADDRVGEMETSLSIRLKDGRDLHAIYDLAQPEPLAQRRKNLRAKGDALIGAGPTERVTQAIAAADLRTLIGVITGT
jgi:2-methylcitrate dehydratase PrpD